MTRDPFRETSSTGTWTTQRLELGLVDRFLFRCRLVPRYRLAHTKGENLSEWGLALLMAQALFVKTGVMPALWDRNLGIEHRFDAKALRVRLREEVYNCDVCGAAWDEDCDGGLHS